VLDGELAMVPGEYALMPTACTPAACGVGVAGDLPQLIAAAPRTHVPS
jgi:hypothetical protein